MRWEWREQAVTALNLQAEAQQPAKGRTRQAQPTGGREFRADNGGMNYGAPPMAALAGLGLQLES